MNRVEIVGDLHLHRRRQVALELGYQRSHALDDRQRVAGWRRLHPDKDRLLAVHHDARVPVLRAEIDRRNVFEPYHGAARDLDHHAFELADVGQPGIGGNVRDGVESFRLTCRGLEVVGPDREVHVVSRDVVRRHPRRVEPQPHRKRLAAQYVGRGNALDGRQQRLHDPGQVVGDRRARQFVAGEPDIHDCGRLTRRFQDDRVERLLRHQVFDLLDLGHDVGQRLVRIVIELDVGCDGAGVLCRAGGQIVDPLRGRHSLLDRGRDKALDQIGRGARIGRRDGNRRVEEPRILPDRQRQHAHAADQQD